MASKILENDLLNKGVLGMADKPGLSAKDMQYKFEEIQREIIIPKLNEVIGEVGSMLSPFDNEKTYDVGEYCIYKDELYKCIDAVTIPGTWNDKKWAFTTLSDALKDLQSQVYVTPQMFGAVGDGIVDDTWAIQTAINSMKPLHIPVGCYRITSPLTVSCSDLLIIGENAPHLQSGLTNAENTLLLKNSFSCLFADFSEDGTLLTVSNTCYRATVENIVFISNKYSMSIGNSTYETAENSSAEIVNGVYCANRVNLSRCAFYGFNGYALSVNAQHSRVVDCIFQQNNDAIHVDSFDHRFSGLWVSCFRRALYSKYEERGKIEINNSWFDQGLGHCMEFASLPTILFNDVWIDLIGGSAIYCESTYGNMAGVFIGRINRTNVLEPYTEFASIQVGRADGLMVIASSTQTHPNGNNSVPLFKYTNMAVNCIFVAPTRNNVYGNSGYHSNLVIDDSGSYITHGSYHFYNGGIQVRPDFSEERVPPQIGSMQFCTSTKILYVCTSLNPVTWLPVSGYNES